MGSFLLGLILTLIATAITRSNIRKEHIDLSEYSLDGWVSWLPDSMGKRALFLGLLVMFVVGLMAVLLLIALGVEQSEPWTYIVAHSVYMGYWEELRAMSQLSEHWPTKA